MWLEHLRIARKALGGHKFRSFLTVLSITIGSFSIVLMSSLAGSGLKTMIRSFEDIGGGRLILVVEKKPKRMEHKASSYVRGLTVADRDALYGALPNLGGHSMYSALGRRDLVGDHGETTRADLLAGDAGLLDMFKMPLRRGRGFTEEENQAHAKVCVIGHKTAQQLFDGDGVGHWLSVGAVRCHVIGQVADIDRWGMDFGFDWAELVALPVQTLDDSEPSGVIKHAQLVLKTRVSRDNEAAKRIVNALMVDRHNGVDDFEIIDFSRFMDKFDQLISIMRAIVGMVAGIALLVGGVGVMNMMLVSVSERVREIGVRKALGASPRDIGAQFLWEAIVLSGSGGLVGVLSGVAAAAAAAAVIGHFKPFWVGTIDQRAAVIALAVSLAIGLLFGFFPARRAARLDAIEAMRR